MAEYSLKMVANERSGSIHREGCDKAGADTRAITDQEIRQLPVDNKLASCCFPKGRLPTEKDLEKEREVAASAVEAERVRTNQAEPENVAVADPSAVTEDKPRRADR